MKLVDVLSAMQEICVVLSLDAEIIWINSIKDAGS